MVTLILHVFPHGLITQVSGGFQIDTVFTEIRNENMRGKKKTYLEIILQNYSILSSNLITSFTSLFMRLLMAKPQDNAGKPSISIVNLFLQL